MQSKVHSLTRQTGAVLVTALVLMAILAVVGVATMRSSTTDISIHKSMKSRNNAFQCAEAALRAGEIWLDTEIDRLPEDVMANPDPGLFQVWNYAAPEIQNIISKDAEWWENNGITYGGGMTNDDYQIGCGAEPRYIVENVGVVDDGTGNVEVAARSKDGINYFKVTAYSIGSEGTASVILQSTFAKRLR